MKRTFISSDVFIFASDASLSGSRVSVAIVWMGLRFSPSRNSVEPLIEFLALRPEVSEVWFICPEDVEPSLASLRSLEDFRMRTSSFATLTLRYFHVTPNAEWEEKIEHRVPSDANEVPICAGAPVIDSIRLDGMRQIFRDSDSLVTASAGFHFERPGRGHSDYFIRTSQSVARAQHAYFIAASLLNRVTNADSVRMFADTAGILPLLYALKDLVHRSSGFERQITVDTFGGYDGAEQNLQSLSSADLVVISSSTSGTLSASLVSRKLAEPGSLVTVFYLSKVAPDLSRGGVLCDLTNRDETVHYSVRDARRIPYDSFTPDGDGCELCVGGSQPIKLAGDEFFPVPSELRLRMLAVTDRPFEGVHGKRDKPFEFDAAPYFEELFGLRAITAELGNDDGRGGSTGSRWGVSTKIDHILSGQVAGGDSARNRVREAIRKLENTEKPVHAVISLSDVNSRALGVFAAREIWGQEYVSVEDDLLVPEGVGRESIVSTLEGLTKPSTVLVCAGVIASGRSLLSMSRQLRGLHDSVETAYVIGVAHPESSNAQTIFKSSLGVRSGDSRSGLEIVWQLPREAGGPSDRNPWQRERDTLTLVDGWLARSSKWPRERRALSARIEMLSNLRDEGLFGSNFVDRADLRTLAPLSPKFALWPFEWSTHPRVEELSIRPTEAEVYATVGHLMYESRRASSRLDTIGSGIRRHGYALNPAIFDRLNEGPLQAAILRSAEPGELNFVDAEDASTAAADVLNYVLANFDDVGGASAYEFLLSISAGLTEPGGPGLRLRREDIEMSLTIVQVSNRDFASFPPLLRAMLLFVRG